MYYEKIIPNTKSLIYIFCISSQVNSTCKHLEQVDGLPVMGFFTLDHAVLLAVLGQLLTYLIIMLEFKNQGKKSIDTYKLIHALQGLGVELNNVTAAAPI